MPDRWLMLTMRISPRERTTMELLAKHQGLKIAQLIRKLVQDKVRELDLEGDDAWKRRGYASAKGAVVRLR
ncbi:MAG: hypothetical protein ACREU5_06850 [Burkholderiales bacterium]